MSKDGLFLSLSFSHSPVLCVYLSPINTAHNTSVSTKEPKEQSRQPWDAKRMDNQREEGETANQPNSIFNIQRERERGRG